jgi:Glucose-6-phosphate dehydrogenase, C-terminal domain
MKFRYKDYFKAEPATGYQTLIYDCLIGDNMLFQRADSIEAGWQAVQPILDAWKKAGATGLEFYPAGSEGPPGAFELLTRDGHSWRKLSRRWAWPLAAGRFALPAQECFRWSVRRRHPDSPPSADLVDMVREVGWILVDADGACLP